MQPAGISPRIYKGETYGIQTSFFFTQTAPFFGKCAYCEKKIGSTQHGDVEHFRPKNAVTDATDAIVTVTMGGASVPVPHPGYYWLAYDWQNLLPSCSLCNTLSRKSEDSRLIGKGTRFPVVGAYATTPGQETNEQPCLLLPTKDDPADHIEMTETGVLGWKTDRGRTTIEILGLNERGLPDERRQVYLTTRDKLAILIAGVVRNEDGRPDRLDTEFQSIMAGTVELSAACKRQ